MSEEELQKRDEIKSRSRSTQKQNEVSFTMIERTKKMIKRARLERSFLLEKLDQVSRLSNNDEEMDSSPPGSPEPHLDREAASAQADQGDSIAAAAAAKRSGGNKLPNAYTMFCEQERDELVKQLENSGQFLKPTAIQSKSSEMWKASSKEEKKPFADKARQLKRKDKGGNDESDDDVSHVKEETEEAPESVAGSEAPSAPDVDWDMNSENQ